MSKQYIGYMGSNNFYKEGDKFYTELDLPASAYVEEGEGTYELDIDVIQQVMTDDYFNYKKDTLNYVAEIDPRLVTPVYLPARLVAIMQQSADNEDERLIDWLLGAIHAQLDVIEEENSEASS